MTHWSGQLIYVAADGVSRKVSDAEVRPVKTLAVEWKEPHQCE
jgi:hypothetical protein